MADQGRANHSHEIGENGRQNPLTCIPRSIHCVDTEAAQNRFDEVDKIMVQEFLNTLAEVALAVASRTIDQNSGGDKLGQ